MSMSEFVRNYRDQWVTIVEGGHELLVHGQSYNYEDRIVVEQREGTISIVRLKDIREAQLPDEPEERHFDELQTLKARLEAKDNKIEALEEDCREKDEKVEGYRRDFEDYVGRYKRLREVNRSLEKENCRLKREHEHLRQQGERVVVPEGLIDTCCDAVVELRNRGGLTQADRLDTALKQSNELPQAKRVEVLGGIYRIEPMEEFERHIPVDTTGHTVWLVPDADGEEGEG